MNRQRFQSEMRRAETMRRTIDPDRSDYWAGYLRGLRRLYHGENFGTPEEHDLWLSLVDRDDDRSRQRGRGYRDGLAFDEATGRGRPSVGDTALPAIRVDAALAEALEAEAARRGVSVPELRREAYRIAVE